MDSDPDPTGTGNTTPSEETIAIEQADGYRIVTIDRPERRNALTPDGLDALEAAIEAATEPVVYLRGAGSAFCAGADFESVAETDDPAAFAAHGQRVARTIATTETVVLAGVDGPARGGGVELALACDVRVCTPRSTFAEPGVEFGLFGAWGGTVRLPRIVGEGNALDLALSGRSIDAKPARRMGLVSRIVDDPESVAAEIADNVPEALAVVKRRIRDRSEESAQTAAEAEAFDRLHEQYAAAIRTRRSPPDRP